MIQQDIYSILNSDDAVIEITARRIYPKRLPDDAVVPAITYKINEINPVRSLSGESGLDNGIIEIICWAKEYKKAQELAFSVRSAFGSSGFAILTGRMQDVEDPETRNYGVLMVMSAWSYSTKWVQGDTLQPAGGLSVSNFIFGETPTPATDGEQLVFTVANPYVAGSLRVTRGSLRMHPVVDFVETSPGAGTFTMAVAPDASEPLIVDYIKV